MRPSRQERQRAHNEQMRKAGEEFSKLLDGAEERKQETAALIFGALGKRYGLGDEEGEGL